MAAVSVSIAVMALCAVLPLVALLFEFVVQIHAVHLERDRKARWTRRAESGETTGVSTMATKPADVDGSTATSTAAAAAALPIVRVYVHALDDLRICMPWSTTGTADAGRACRRRSRVNWSDRDLIMN